MPLYDALMSALGLTHLKGDASRVVYVHPDPQKPCFALIEDPDHRANRSCIAFWAGTKEDVDALARTARQAGALAIEGPALCPEYSPGYYAVFFEDVGGNRLEVCCRSATPQGAAR